MKNLIIIVGMVLIGLTSCKKQNSIKTGVVIEKYSKSLILPFDLFEKTYYYTVKNDYSGNLKDFKVSKDEWDTLIYEGTVYTAKRSW